MRLRRTAIALVAAAAAAALVPGAASAARLDVRADFTNATDQRVDLQVWRDGRWQALRSVAPGDTVRDITNRDPTLNLFVADCGQVTLFNPWVGYPAGYVVRNFALSDSAELGQGQSDTVSTRGGLRATFKRDDDSDAFKEMRATLRACDVDNPVTRPAQPVPPMVD